MKKQSDFSRNLMKVLITGSNGLLGQKLLHKLRVDDSLELIDLFTILVKLNNDDGFLQVKQ